MESTDHSPAAGDPQAPSIEGRYERIRAAKRAQEALLSRPRFSLRLQIFLAFLLVFLLATGIASALMIATYQVEAKVGFLEIANDYAVQVEDLRRLEKNFFLYGTGLDAARQTADQAIETLERNEEEICETLGRQHYAAMVGTTEHYGNLLEKLSQLELTPKAAEYQSRKNSLEVEVRRQGRKMVALSMDFVEKEKQSMSTAISRARNIHIYSLVLLLISMVIIAYLLGSRLLMNIVRFESYARRIARGDFTPIQPARRYRDEFTALALSINDMLLELESHAAVLVQSHKMQAVGTLTAGIAHELNNPLNNITLTTYSMLEEYDGLCDDERKEMVHDLIEESERAQAIVRNLLDFARESGTQLEPLDLRQLVKTTIKLAANEIKVSGVTVEYKDTGSLPRIHGDKQQLRQVFLNLILNALAASSKGDRLEILVLPADEPGEVAVKVVDFGTGIPESIQHRIFDPFFTTKEKDKGTGLGLSVSQGIIAKHGGRIRVSSQEGRGSTFTVILPVTTIVSPQSK
jgi:two-component system NtrC family sensor kinase